MSDKMDLAKIIAEVVNRLMLRTASGNISPVILAYIHRDCMPALADFLEVEIPDYAVLHHRTTKPRDALPERLPGDPTDWRP